MFIDSQLLEWPLGAIGSWVLFRLLAINCIGSHGSLKNERKLHTTHTKLKAREAQRWHRATFACPSLVQCRIQLEQRIWTFPLWDCNWPLCMCLGREAAIQIRVYFVQSILILLDGTGEQFYLGLGKMDEICCVQDMDWLQSFCPRQRYMKMYSL